MSISLSKEATISILVHSSKYSGSYICGVLFKKESDSRSESATEIIPLFHSLPLLPLSETAADLVVERLKEINANLIGFYYGNEPFDGKKVPVLIQKFFTTIETKSEIKTPKPIFRCITSDVMNDLERDSILINVEANKPAETPKISTEELKKAAFAEIVDFEEFLENPSKKWLL